MRHKPEIILLFIELEFWQEMLNSIFYVSSIQIYFSSVRCPAGVIDKYLITVDRVQGYSPLPDRANALPDSFSAFNTSMLVMSLISFDLLYYWKISRLHTLPSYNNKYVLIWKMLYECELNKQRFHQFIIPASGCYQKYSHSLPIIIFPPKHFHTLIDHSSLSFLSLN